MKKRLLSFSLLAVVMQLLGSGCFFHAAARWRENHPCGICTHYHPLLHPFQTRRAAIAEAGGTAIGPVYGPNYGPVTSPPCHGCGTPGIPVSYGGYPSEFTPVTNPPTIGQPMPLTPGPKIVPYNGSELPMPMQLAPPKTGNGGNH